MRPRSRSSRFWLITLSACIGAALTLSLGFWQLSRAAEKLALQAALEGQGKRVMLDSRTLSASKIDSDALYRTVSVRGTWIANATVFLDNRQMYAKAGFFVMTPLRLENSATAVVVQRGWVQRSFTDRTRLPVVPTPAGPVELTGRIAPPPSKLYEFEASVGGTIRQNLGLAEFSREIDVPLAPVSVQQLSAAPDGLARDWPVVDSGVDKHYGYAFQWFAMCALIVFLYGWFQIVRRFFLPP